MLAYKKQLNYNGNNISSRPLNEAHLEVFCYYWGHFLLMTKKFKSIEQQIEILRERGLIINDYNKAFEFLYTHNYYRVSGYTLTLRKNDRFYPNFTMDNIMEIYYCDEGMRHILLKYLEMIETKVKSIYAYEFCKIYDPLAYLDAKNFNNINIHCRIMQKSQQLKKVNHQHEAYIKHYMDDLNEAMPLWTYIDLFTISDISFLYQISEKRLKKAVANGINISTPKADTLLEHFLHSLTILRNLCAHGSRLYNRLFEQRPRLNKQEKALLIIKDNIIDNAHLYSFIIIMKRLLSSSEIKSFKTEINNLFKNYQFVDIKYYGFRYDWLNTL